MADRRNALTARIAKGFKDTPASDLRHRDDMIAKIRAVYELFGFEPLETPSIEYVDVLGKFMPEQDQPDGGIFALQDNDEQWIALRYDLTAPLSRYIAENWKTMSLPFRRYQIGPVWRNEKPGPGRYREFLQFDVDTVGSSALTVDAEHCAVMAAALEAIGIARGDYEIRLNNRKVLDGVLELIGLDTDASQGKTLPVLRSIDKFDRVGFDGVQQLLTTGRKDDSGDFTKGAGLSGDQAERVLAFMKVEGGTRMEVCAGLREVVQGSETGLAGVGEMEQIAAMLDAMGVEERQVVFDPSVVRGLDYYTGPVFEAAMTFDILDEKGQPRQFGSIGGGGRYDGLVDRFVGKPVPAAGFSIGVDRMLAALDAAGRIDREAEAAGPVLVTIMDFDRIADYARIAQELRAAGIVTELYPGTSKFKAQMKYADRRNAPVAIIAGSDEFEAGTVSVKNLVLGSRLAKAIDDHEEWKDKSRAQQIVARGDLVSTVKDILATLA